MTVMLARQPEMPLVLPAVARFLHGAEHYAVYEIEFPRAFEGFQNPLKVFGRDRLRVKPRAYAQRVQIGAEPLRFVGRGPLVNAVEKRQFLLFAEFRNALVGGDHELFDQPMRKEPGVFRNLDLLPVYGDVRLLDRQIHRTAFSPR